MSIGAMDDATGHEVGVYERFNNATGVGWGLHGTPVPNPDAWRRRLALSYYQIHGYYVSLSGNGEGMAIGSLTGEFTTETSEEYDSAELVVRIYSFNTTSREWSSVGEEISRRQHYLYDTPRSILPQRSLVVSHDATVVAIGSFNSVDAYSWNGTTWASRQVDLNITESMGLVG